MCLSSVDNLQADRVGEDHLEIPGSCSQSRSIPLHFDCPGGSRFPFVPLGGVILARVVTRTLSLNGLVKRTVPHLGVERRRHQHWESWKGVEEGFVEESSGETDGKEGDREASHPHP